eukprot:10862618-Alexandrium_andersonii.AAC.1
MWPLTCTCRLTSTACCAHVLGHCAVLRIWMWSALRGVYFSRWGTLLNASLPTVGDVFTSWHPALAPRMKLPRGLPSVST